MVGKILVVVAVLLTAAHCFTETEYKDAFADWTTKYGKVYLSENFFDRYTIFKSNMDFVHEFNSNPDNTHEVELNKFADLTNEEYRRIYLGARVDGASRLSGAGPFVNITEPLADNVNWANKGAVLPVKDQGQCGSCWAFSTTGSVEALNQMYTGNLISLSEQNLIDCTLAQPYGNGGCNGGWMDTAYKYIIANNGIEREANYPYQAVNGPCRFNAAFTGAAMRNYADVQSGNEGALVSAINIQPVSVTIDASKQSFQLYKSGIYYEGACSTTNLDHAVLAIGYGSENGDYYIVKNSWGAGWGMSGYIWMSRNRGNNCGIATAATRPLAS